MRKIKTAVIGCGKVAHLHAAALATLPQSHFTAVCSSAPDTTRQFAEQYGVQPFTDLDAMLASGVEAVTICTPHPLHADPAVRAALAGKHLLVEKPLASSLGDCDRILDAARRGGVKVSVVSQRRFYAPCQRIRRAIDDGKLGRPILGTVTMYGWRDQAYYQSDPWRGKWEGEGGGVLVNQAPHQIDLLLWFLGPVLELCGYWANLNHPYIEVEDTAVAILRFASGALGQILVSNSQNPALHCRVSVHGSNGASVGVQTDGGAMFIAGMLPITEPPLNDLWTVPSESELLKQWKKEDTAQFAGMNAMEHYHRLQIEDFLNSIIEDRAPSITGEDGRRTVEVFNAIYQSQRERGPVAFPLDSGASHPSPRGSDRPLRR